MSAQIDEVEHVAAIEHLQAQLAIADAQLRGRDRRIERLRAALIQMVDEKCDYMRINNLGDPETQHTVKAARAALAQ